MSEELTKDQQERLELGWKCILEQFREHSKTNTQKEGAGMNIYRLLTATNAKGTNCEYYYAEYKTEVWTEISKHNPGLENLYQPTKNYVICVQVPEHPDDYNNTIGNCRVFNIDDDTEVFFSEPDIPSSQEGIHHRKSTSYTN